MVCYFCIIPDQEGHPRQKIASAANNQRYILRDILAKTSDALEEVKKVKGEVHDIIRRIETKCSAGCRAIDKEAEEMKELISKRASKLKGELEEMTKFKMDELNKQSDFLGQLLEEDLQADKNLIEGSDNIQLLKSIRQTIREKHIELQTKIQAAPHAIKYQDSLAIDTRNKELLLDIERWGCVSDVTDNIIDFNNCMVLDIPKKVSVNKNTGFTILLKSKDGKNVQYTVQPKVTIMDAHACLIEPKVVFDEKRCLYKVSYTPRTSGQYNVTVSLSGRQLKDGPFFVLVEEEPALKNEHAIKQERTKTDWSFFRFLLSAFIGSILLWLQESIQTNIEIAIPIYACIQFILHSCIAFKDSPKKNSVKSYLIGVPLTCLLCALNYWVRRTFYYQFEIAYHIVKFEPLLYFIFSGIVNCIVLKFYMK